MSAWEDVLGGGSLLRRVGEDSGAGERKSSGGSKKTEGARPLDGQEVVLRVACRVLEENPETSGTGSGGGGLGDGAGSGKAKLDMAVARSSTYACRSVSSRLQRTSCQDSIWVFKYAGARSSAFHAVSRLAFALWSPQTSDEGG